MEQKSPAKKVTLINKLLASYAAISFFTIAALSISYTGLYSLTKITRDIVTNDFVVIDAANKLRESILAQQSYAAKFAILKGPEFRELYLQREAEFLDILQRLQTAHHDRSLDEIAVAYRDFRTVAYSLFQGSAQ